MDSGIYLIRNLVNQREYVGSTTSFKRRKSTHWSSLSHGTHHSKDLQTDWNAFGKSAFEFVILEQIDAKGKGRGVSHSALLEREQWHLDNGVFDYNTSRKAGTRKGVPHTPEMRQQKADHLRKITQDPQWRLEHSRKIKLSTQDPVRNQALRERFKAIASKPENRERSRQIRIAANKARGAAYVGPERTLVSPEGIPQTFTRICDFAKEHGLKSSNVSGVLSGKKKSIKGWKLPQKEGT